MGLSYFILEPENEGISNGLVDAYPKYIFL